MSQKSLYYYDSNNQKQGPFYADDLPKFVREQKVTPETKIEFGGKTCMAGDIKSLWGAKQNNTFWGIIFILLFLVIGGLGLFFVFRAFSEIDSLSTSILLTYGISFAITVFFIWGIVKIISNQNKLIEKMNEKK